MVLEHGLAQVLADSTQPDIIRAAAGALGDIAGRDAAAIAALDAAKSDKSGLVRDEAMEASVKLQRNTSGPPPPTESTGPRERS
jgi:hypothetical protein